MSLNNSSSFSVLFWTNKAKSTKEGMVPLYARVTVDGKRVEISLKRKVNIKKWDASTGFMKGSGDDVRVTNNYINETNNFLFEIYSNFRKKDTAVTAEGIKMMFTGPASVAPERRTFLAIFDDHNSDVEKLIGKDYVKATLTKYKTIRGKVGDFIKHHYRKNDLFLDELDFAFISNFEKYLKIEAGIEHNTTMVTLNELSV